MEIAALALALTCKKNTLKRKNEEENKEVEETRLSTTGLEKINYR